MDDLKELAKASHERFRCKICDGKVPDIDKVFLLLDSYGMHVGDVHIECLDDANRLIGKGGLEEIKALYADYG